MVRLTVTHHCVFDHGVRVHRQGKRRVVEEIIGRLPELTAAQLGRLEEELRRERQRRASSAGGGEGAPRAHEGAAPLHPSRRLAPRARTLLVLPIPRGWRHAVSRGQDTQQAAGGRGGRRVAPAHTFLGGTRGRQRASLEGLDGDRLRLVRSRAVDQPFGTCTRPLRLTKPTREALPKLLIALQLTARAGQGDDRRWAPVVSKTRRSRVEPCEGTHGALAAVLQALGPRRAAPRPPIEGARPRR